MLVNEAAPDMVLLDLGLPDIRGLELLPLLKAVPEAFPIVVMTSSSAEQDRSAALAVGADQFVTKPSSFEDLVAIVSQLALRFRPAR
jgi:two-component system KDP operon response regulator KdpE